MSETMDAFARDQALGAGEDRERCDVFQTYEGALKASDSWDSPIHSIRHIIKYKDGFKLLGHINCEHCRYCEETNANRALYIEKPPGTPGMPSYWTSGPHEEKTE